MHGRSWGGYPGTARDNATERRIAKLDEQLKHLMKELDDGIKESLSESERIAEVIVNIKYAGYDVFLVLAATIGFNRPARRKIFAALSVFVKRNESGHCHFSEQKVTA